MTYDEFKKQYASNGGRSGMTIGHPEEDLQRECVQWFRDSYPELAPLLFHPNNEPFFGGRGKTEQQKAIAGARAKRIGVVPGVADLILMMPNNCHHALAIEMKTISGRQSDTQKHWQKAVEAQGYRYEVVRSLDRFKEIMVYYIGRKPKDPELIAVEKVLGHPVRKTR